jgi:predicted HTH transcriptional regulator
MIKKRQLNLHSREEESKILKHICALSNSNPTNNSYIVVGVEDQENTIVGDDFLTIAVSKSCKRLSRKST